MTGTVKKVAMRITFEATMLEIAGKLGKILEARGVVYLRGDLGAGKTTFFRGILRAYGYEGAVKSPTFTLVEPYDLQWGQVYHFDLYRIADPEELEFLGIEDYLAGGHLCLIEWSERGQGFLPDADIIVNIGVDKMERALEITSMSEYGNRVVSELNAQMPEIND